MAVKAILVWTVVTTETTRVESLNLTDMNKMNTLRCALNNDVIQIDLHGFSDASECAYSAAVYIRCPMKYGEYQTNLLHSKPRMSLMKTITIPCLELCCPLD